ncbi:hypothetical protein SGM_5899 [Streptomyces griseoaurantiacus M045]|uniref:Uncharacterized protein n=1 Tax=Streptomyces griseoaurantiacus M045 TaxID=996637 RepID=F3NRY5_9ACTN|nr:hypothetical protein SGM_5899 [Streptomyces griseoaurantiacus M045]
MESHRCLRSQRWGNGRGGPASVSAPLVRRLPAPVTGRTAALRGDWPTRCTGQAVGVRL